MAEHAASDSVIIPVMSQSVIPFVSKLGDEFRERGYEVTFVPQNKPPIIRDAKDFLDEDSLLLNHVDNNPEVPFDSLLQKYDIDFPRSLVFPQMVYDHAYTNVDHQPFLSGPREVDYEPYFDLLHYSLDAFDRLFEAGKGGIPLQHQGAEILRRTLQRVAEHHDVRSVWTGFSPLDGHMGLFDDESVDWETFEPEYDASMTDEQRNAAREFISHVRDRREVIGEQPSGFGFNPAEIAWRSVDRSRRLFASEHDSKEMIDRWLRHNAQKVGKRLKARIASHLYLGPECSNRIVENEQYVFFPLQYAQESRVTVRAPAYYDLPWILEYLSRSLPHGYELVVKDHPHQVGSLPLDAMRAISRHSKALDPHMNAHDIVRNADAVVTLNNTVGYEALVHGKPVVTLGSAFYDGAGYSFSLDDIETLPGVVKEAIVSSGLDEENVIIFAHRIIQGSYPGTWSCTNDKNVSVVVDSILNFLND